MEDVEEGKLKADASCQISFFQHRVVAMFESPALNLLTGAFIAGIVGVVTAFAGRLIHNRFRRRTVARAIFTEMIQALNHMSAAIEYLDKITQFRDPSPTHFPLKLSEGCAPWIEKYFLPWAKP